MAFETSQRGYKQMSPSFGFGYPYDDKYHNIGQLQTPYQSKQFSNGGDYAPPQATTYYTPQNRTYPYVMDNQFRGANYLPSECCGSLPNFQYPSYFRGYNPQYPDEFIIPNYFTPTIHTQTGHYKGHYIPPKTITCSPVGPSCARVNAMDDAVDREGYERLKIAYTGLEGRRI